MSPSSISNSKGFTWARLRREVGRFLLLLVCLELLCRWEPIHNYLSQTLDSYESLLWYTPYMPSYESQLQTHPDYSLWLVGSSYMMTGLNPQSVQDSLHERGLGTITAQNYGMDRMMDFDVMSQVFDHWMFTFEQPKYIVIGISQRNFTTAASEPPPILTSPYENMYIFPHRLDDYITGFLYKNSLFYHYAILARNALFIPRDRTIRDPLPLGGYTELTTTYDCGLNANTLNRPVTDMQGGLTHLDRLIDVVRAHHIQVFVVNIPMPLCTVTYEGYNDFNDYVENYLNAVAKHLQNENVSFKEFDTLFQAEIPEAVQRDYFADSAHPNDKGAALFSQWTADAVATWLKALPAQSGSGN